MKVLLQTAEKNNRIQKVKCLKTNTILQKASLYKQKVCVYIKKELATKKV